MNNLKGITCIMNLGSYSPNTGMETRVLLYFTIIYYIATTNVVICMVDQNSVPYALRSLQVFY